ncbi:UNVERIFIED_CONTAM: hypothetical protein HDU68_011157 [Siphonaria sp. JEL0065]|nr:hypothetical protein HDU68_011157 [Siphonaria sp. JEL0065]
MQFTDLIEFAKSSLASLTDTVLKGNSTNQVATVAGIPLIYFLYKFILYPVYLTPLRRVPGPKLKNPFLMAGHMREVIADEPGTSYVRWSKELNGAKVFKYYRLFNEPAVIILSPSAIKRVLGTHAHLYGKSSIPWKMLHRFFGPGLLTVDGDVHKRQRAVANPAFRLKNLTALIPIFLESAQELASSWNQTHLSLQESAQIDVAAEMSKPTLDIIGRAGFGYEFNSVAGGESPLSYWMNTLLGQFQFKNVLVDSLLPFVKWIVPAEWKRHVDVRDAQAKAFATALRIVEERRRELQSGGGSVDAPDLLTLFLKANTEAEVKNRLSDKELMAQVLTFLLAGHETTSVSLGYLFDFLAKNPSVQQKLRNEVITEMETVAHTPSDEYIISTTTYLDAVCKESLRLAPAAPVFHRICLQDDVLDGYKIPKGTFIGMSPLAMHLSEEYWGPDAAVFKPERWTTNTASAGSNDAYDEIGRPYGSYLPFSMGTRNCIGAKFAMMEMKSIVAVLLTMKAVPGILLKLKRVE